MVGTDQNELALASFRQEWHDEIRNRQGNENYSPEEIATRTSETSDADLADKEKAKGENSEGNSFISTAEKEKEEKAKCLFLKGVEKERQKRMYEAIYFYKQAIHLVPDIESKIADYPTKTNHDSSDSSSDDENDQPEQEIDSSNDLEELTRQFKVLGVGGLCSRAFPSRETHISVLPSELLAYVFRWVVSDELDLRSLEKASLVCKWFFACARDDSLWRTICLRVWGVNCGSPNVYDGCWRRMLVERPHLYFNGIYINKNSYVRAGEQSLDSYYRPYHIVEYYRYIRFYADGTALLCTTTDEPSSVLPMLRRKEETSMVLRGHFRLFEDSVTIVATRLQKSVSEPRNRRRNKQTSVQEQVFQMELRLKSSGKRKNNQLQLVNYSYTINNKSTGRTTTNQIDVQSFKPFVFSRVKSFHIVSQAPL